MNMTTRERILVGLMIAGIVVCLLCIVVGAAQAEGGDCEKVADIQPDEGETRVEYTDPQGRELCRLKIYLHDRTVIGFAPPGGEHDGYAASFNGAHVQGHRTDPNVDLISHAQVFAVANIPPTEITPTEPSGVTPTPTLIPPTPTDTALPPTATATLPPGVTPTATPTLPPGVTVTATHLPPTLIPPVEITPTPSDTPTVDIYYPPPEEGKSPPPAPRLPETGMNGTAESTLTWAFVISFALVIGFAVYKGFKKG